ncbi:type II CAAX prenyl endopeptidase Rce1 family protein [Methanobrevibacter sp.]|uniref:CPBP family glutamic-type intramembrane protease n=1 Tax=Methanobrevibacter sp. TaxID=66852 RepID=UPI00388DBE0B
MAEIDRFKFEDGDYDFPFYNKNPHIPKWGWIILFFAFLIGSVLSMSEKIYFLISGCIVLIVPVLYFLKWDYNAIFRIPSRRDIVLVVALFAGYMIYSLVMGLILSQFGIVSSGTVDSGSLSGMSLVNWIFAVMGEEFMKFIPFMFFLRVIYKYSNNRKLSVIMSVAIMMVMFASLHAYNPIMFIFALFIQGFGSIFEFYGYIKTKNILVPYLSHLLTDEFILIISLLGFV